MTSRERADAIIRDNLVNHLPRVRSIRSMEGSANTIACIFGVSPSVIRGVKRHHMETR
jgi:hypothetical protein